MLRHGPHRSTPGRSPDRDPRRGPGRPPPRTVAARPDPGLGRPRAGHGPGARPTPAAPAGIEALLGGLNPDQRRAVTHGDGPLLVVAGAGTGKTQVITRRIAWLIATRRAKPSEILALTFTDKAADEMQVRVDQLVPYGYTDTRDLDVPRVRRPAHPRVRARARPAAGRARPVARRGRDLPARAPVRVRARRVPAARRPDPVPRRRSRRCSAAARTRTSRPATYLAHAERLARRRPREARRRSSRPATSRPMTLDPAARPPRRPRRQGELARAYAPLPGAARRERVHRLRRPGRPRAAAACASRRRPARPIAGRFRYVLVDEFQDTNRAQAELVALLAEPHRNVTVVGDDDQSIYKFRGAAISNILEFRERYRGRPDRRPAPQLPVARARSSTRRYRLVRFNDPDRLEVRAGLVKRLRAERARRRRAAPVRHEAFATGAEEADWIAADIARRIADGRRAARPRGPRPGQRPRRPDPAGAQPRRHPVAVLRHVRAVRPARGPAAAGVPAGDRGPGRRASTCTRWRRRSCTASAART